MRARASMLGMLLALALGMLGSPAQSATLTFDFVDVMPEHLFANSRESGVPRGFLGFRGRVPGATVVEVTITDDLTPQTPPVTLNVTPYPQDEPGDGLKAGDFIGNARVTDLGRHTVDESIVNTSPSIEVPAAQSVEAGSPLSFTITAGDLDEDDLILQAAGLPDGAAFDGPTGVFTWTPTASQQGTHSVVFAASDGRGGAASGTVAITVGADPGINRAPGISAPPSTTVSAGNPTSVNVLTDDPDGDPVSLTALALPAGASLAGGTLSWTPGPQQAGSHGIVFAASDGKGGLAAKMVAVHVLDLTKLGPSVLTVTFVARNEGGDVSTPVVRTATKYAGTPGDLKSPIIVTGKRATDPNPNSSNQTGPPQNWCHVLATSAGDCAIAVSGLTPRTPWFASVPNPQPPTGVAIVSGVVEDGHADSLGIGSEIADVQILVTDFRGIVLTEIHSFLRTGTSAFFNAKLYIQDYPPNIPGQAYVWRVQARDAWGREADFAAGTFNVYPV